MKKKINVKKINKKNSATVRVLACHCGCQGKGLTAVAKGYFGQYL